MTTTQETPSIAELLRAQRAGGPKAPIYRELGVSPQTYEAWESGMYVPGDEYAETLAGFLELDESRIVWLLYRDRVRRRKGVSRSSFALVPQLARAAA